MAATAQATYSTRRGAELAVERLVQEHEVDRKAISVRAQGTDNSAGEVASGADRKPDKSGDGEPQLNGRVEVTVTNAAITSEKLQAALKETGGEDIR